MNNATALEGDSAFSITQFNDLVTFDCKKITKKLICYIYVYMDNPRPIIYNVDPKLTIFLSS